MHFSEAYKRRKVENKISGIKKNIPYKIKWPAILLIEKEWIICGDGGGIMEEKNIIDDKRSLLFWLLTHGQRQIQLNEKNYWKASMLWFLI